MRRSLTIPPKLSIVSNNSETNEDLGKSPNGTSLQTTLLIQMWALGTPSFLWHVGPIHILLNLLVTTKDYNEVIIKYSLEVWT